MGIYDAIRAGAYENKVPARLDHEPIDADNMTVRQLREHKEARMKRQRAQRLLHAEESRRRIDMFREDLEKEHGVVGHPKAGKLFEFAWSEGHSGGFQEVANYYAELVELIT